MPHWIPVPRLRGPDDKVHIWTWDFDPFNPGGAR